MEEPWPPSTSTQTTTLPFLYPLPRTPYPTTGATQHSSMAACEDCFEQPVCCIPSPLPIASSSAASTSARRVRAVSSEFCCEEPDCLVPGTEAGLNSCDEVNCYLGWDELISQNNCAECEATLGCDGCGAEDCCGAEGRRELVWGGNVGRVPFDSFTECCIEDCFGPLGGPSGGDGMDIDCPDCWDPSGSDFGSSTVGGKGKGRVGADDTTESGSSVATPADREGYVHASKSPELALGEVLKGMDDNALQQILDCCCGGPESHPHPSNPSTCPPPMQRHNPSFPPPHMNHFALPAPHPYHHQQHLHPMLLPADNVFPCKWSDCNLYFSDKDKLVEHVNGDHLCQPPALLPPAANFTASQLAMEMDRAARCLWDDCDTGTPLPPSTNEYSMSSLRLDEDNRVQQDLAAVNVLKNHLYEEHLAGLKPGDVRSLHSTLPITHKSKGPSSSRTHIPGHTHTRTPHSHSSSLTQRHSHTHPHAHPYGVHPRRPSSTSIASSTPSDASTAGSHACRWRDCPLTFPSSALLMTHISEDHVGSGKAMYDCRWEGCDRNTEQEKGFAQRQKVMRHLQTHTGDRPFVCETCGKAFSEMTTLTQHMRVHTNERPFKCTFPSCDKAFSLASALTIHLRTHTGAKPFICPYPGCQSAFSESSNFSKHVRTHKGEKAYPCEECGKAFKRSDQLSRHRKIHERKRAEEGEEEDEDS